MRRTDEEDDVVASDGLCADRVVVVTGAGRGIGRQEALQLAQAGASVVVNDTGVSRDGAGHDRAPADAVVAEVRAAGGVAIANYDDVSDFQGAKNLIDSAIGQFGSLDVVVNNAGILRDRMLVNMSIDEWDEVLRVHLRGTFSMSRHAAAFWREQSKAGHEVDARIINTSSSSGIYGNVGQSNYGAAKAGIAAFTIISALELGRYGITCNAIAPAALTRMTEGLTSWRGDSESGWDPRDPSNIAPLVVWLGSVESRKVTGRVFNVSGGAVSVAEGWVAGEVERKGRRWEAEDFGEVIPRLVGSARPNSDMRGCTPSSH